MTSSSESAANDSLIVLSEEEPRSFRVPEVIVVSDSDASSEGPTFPRCRKKSEGRPSSRVGVGGLLKQKLVESNSSSLLISATRESSKTAASVDGPIVAWKAPPAKPTSPICPTAPVATEVVCIVDSDEETGVNQEKRTRRDETDDALVAPKKRGAESPKSHSGSSSSKDVASVKSKKLRTQLRTPLNALPLSGKSSLNLAQHSSDPAQKVVVSGDVSSDASLKLKTEEARSPSSNATSVFSKGATPSRAGPALRRRADPFFGSAGKIARVVLRDFCNHRLLDWSPSPYANVVLGGNGQGKSAIAKAVFICCGAERLLRLSKKEDGGDGALLTRGVERIRLFQYIREFWSPSGPSKAVVSITLSNFASSGGGAASRRQSSAGRSDAEDVSGSVKTEVAARDEPLISRVSRLTGDDFVPIDRAYKHSVYGDYITLTREIHKKRQETNRGVGGQVDAEAEIGSGIGWTTGSTCWFIEGTGPTQKTRREAKPQEVRAMLEHFNIAVTNPAVYLSQEIAKNFLLRASPSRLYNFYIDANGLDAARNDLRKARELQSAAQTELAEFRSTLEPLKAKAAQLAEELQHVRELSEMRKEEERLQRCLPWIRLREAEEATRLLREEVERRRAAASEEGRSREAEVQYLRKELESQKRTLEERLREADALRLKLDSECRASLDSATRVFRSKQQEKASVEEEAREAEEMEQALIDSIRELSQSLEEAEAPASLKEDATSLLRTRLAEAEKALQEAATLRTKLTAAVHTAQRKETTLRKDLTEAEVERDAAAEEARAAASEVSEQRLALSRLAEVQEEQLRASQASKASKGKTAEEACAQVRPGATVSRSTEAVSASTCSFLRSTPEAPSWRQFVIYRLPVYFHQRWAGAVSATPDLIGIFEELLRLVSRGALSQVPVGPLGEWISVDEAECRRVGAPVQSILEIAEEHLQHHTGLWLVPTYDDQRILLPLLEKFNWPAPRVSIVNFSESLYTPLRADSHVVGGSDSQVLTLFKALSRKVQPGSASPLAAGREGEAVPAVVLNFLVDIAGVEKVALVRTRQELRSLLRGGAAKSGLREGYSWMEVAHMRKLGKGAEAVPMAPVGGRKLRGVIRVAKCLENNFVQSDKSDAQEKQNSKTTKFSTLNLPTSNATLNGPVTARRSEADENFQDFTRSSLEEAFESERRREEAALQEKLRVETEARTLFTKKKHRLEKVRDKAAAALKTLREAEEADLQQASLVMALQEKVDELKAELKLKAPEAVAGAGSLDDIRKSIKAKEARRKVEERKKLRLRERAFAFEEQIKKAKEDVRKARAKVEAAEAECKEAERNAELARRGLKASEEELEEKQLAITEERAKAQRNRADLVEKERELEASEAETQALRAACTPLREGEVLSSDSFTKERRREKKKPLTSKEFASIQETQMRIRKLQGKIHSDAATWIRSESEVQKEVEETAMLLRAKQTQLKEPEKAVQLAQANTVKRVQKYKSAIQSSTEKTRQGFKAVVEKVLPHKATLVFDHRAGTLEIQTLDKSNVVSNKTKALSGGEKSCVQIALLSALAEQSHSPLHIFDELDVFMDERNRITNFLLLLEMALEMRETSQFFLITPHSEIQSAIHEKFKPSDVKVFSIRGSGPSGHDQRGDGSAQNEE